MPKFLSSVGAVIAVAVLLLSADLVLGQSRTPPPPDPIAVQQQLLRDAIAQAQAAARAANETSVKAKELHEQAIALETRVKADLERGEQLVAWADRLIAFVEAGAALLTVLALILGGVAAFEVFSWKRKLQNAQSEYAGAKKRLLDTVSEAQARLQSVAESGKALTSLQGTLEGHAQFHENLRTQLKTALGQVRTGFAKLPGSILVCEVLAGSVHQGAYDDDSLIVFGDRLGITGLENEELAEVFVLVGQYWRGYGEFRRSIARLERALSLNPQSARAHQILGRALWNWVGFQANGRLPDQDGSKLLEEAKNQISEAARIRGEAEEGEDLVGDRAAICFVSGDYVRAAEHYAIAMRRSVARAERENHLPDFDYGYALGCALAKQRLFNEAFETLGKVADQSMRFEVERGTEVECDYRRYIREDVDLREMREDKEWGPKLTELCAEADRRVTATTDAATRNRRSVLAEWKQGEAATARGH
jgi:tetratricopeptide (TPR) repeat protein